MPNLHVLKSNKLTRIFLISLGVVAASITCVNPASADETVSLDATTVYIDYQVYSTGGSYVIRGFGDDPVVQLYRGTSIPGFDNQTVTVSGDFLAADDDGGRFLPDESGSGLDSYLSGNFSSGLGNYVIRVTSYDYWRTTRSGTPTESYTLRYTGFSRGTVSTTTRQTHNLSFSNSLYGSDKLSDPTGELKNTVDSINAKWGYLLK